ncbi:MAG: hypothetical protein K0R26_1943 [Bacteroidota bacterium]|jgi:hypothetical protein|nr:hypothetical protein [Bacteroidota bacterium]
MKNTYLHKRLAIFALALLTYSTGFGQNLQWSNQLSLNKKTLSGGVICDTLNNIYVGGSHISDYTGSVHSGFYRAKIDQSGNVIWSDTTKFNSWLFNTSFNGDKAGNTYIGGECYVNFKVADSLLTYASNGSNGYFVKFNPAGDISWTQALYRAVPRTISLVNNGNIVYIAGHAGEPTQIDDINVPTGGFVAKFNSTGICQKVIHVGSKGAFFSGIDSLNNFYVQIGKPTETKTLNKYSSNDSLLWSIPITGTSIFGMTVDKAGNTYITGETPAGSFTYKINSQGQLLWNNSHVSYLPLGYIYPNLTQNVYCSVEALTTGEDSVENYLNTYNSANGILVSSHLIPLINPLAPSCKLRKGRMMFDKNMDLIVTGEQTYDKVSLNIYKYSLGNATSVKVNKKETHSFVLYPNPTQSKIQISYTTDKRSIIEVCVIDSKGLVVFQSGKETAIGVFSKEIDLSRFSKGTYLVELFVDDKRMIQKVIVN